MIYSAMLDEYADDLDGVKDWCENDGWLIDELRLQPTCPRFCWELDVNDIYADIIPPDTDAEEVIPQTIINAFDALNDAVRARREDSPISWWPKDAALIVDIDLDREAVDRSRAMRLAELGITS